MSLRHAPASSGRNCNRAGQSGEFDHEVDGVETASLKAVGGLLAYDPDDELKPSQIPIGTASLRTPVSTVYAF